MFVLVAPFILSILDHIIVILYSALVAILSVWTIHRVHLARRSTPRYDEPISLLKDRRPLPRRPQSWSTTVASPRRTSSPVTRRSLSYISTPPTLSGSSSPAPSSPLLSPRSISDSPRLPEPDLASLLTPHHGPKSSLPTSAHAQPLVVGIPGLPNSSYWLTEKASGSQNEAALEESSDEEKAPNSPTGSLTSFKEDGWTWGEDEDAAFPSSSKSSHWTLFGLTVLRTLCPLPAVAIFTHSSEYTWDVLFKTAFDLVLLDYALSFALAIFPLMLVAFRLSFTLPRSFSHHVYYCSLVLLFLPLLSSMQLPPTASISIYRMASPIISAITLLMARDQAARDYWLVLNHKARWSISSTSAPYVSA